MILKLKGPKGTGAWIVPQGDDGAMVFMENVGDPYAAPAGVDIEGVTVIELEVTAKGLSRARGQVFWR